jgi:NADH:ubiquinone oxidoreductase subunit 5 (subunit L)/multisubunit Na+/H+ antiporter MnhA subunit
VLRFLALLLLGWMACIGALALACFVKATGVAFLGRPRSPGAERAHEVPAGMRGAQIALAVCCVALGLLAPVVLRVLHPLVAPLEPEGLPLMAAWTLPTTTLVLVLGATAALLALGLGSMARRQPARSGITWECGFGPLTSRMQVSATSFAQPITRLFGALFRYAILLRIAGVNRRLFPEEIRVQSHTENVLASHVYEPLVRGVNRVGSWVVRLQAGSIHLYLVTIFGTLLLLLTLVGGYAR